MTNPVIGIAGFKGSGKSLLAARIRSHLDRSAHIVSFAGPVKETAQSMGWNGEKDRKGRRLLQLLGTECGRECIDPLIWVKKWLEVATQCLHAGIAVLADDLRFRNEADAIRDLGGMLILVERPGYGYRFKWRNPVSWWRALRAHGSEQSLPAHLFHLTFVNDGSIDALDRFAADIAFILDRNFPCSLESTLISTTPE